MPSYNKIMLLGHLTRNVETRTIAGGSAVAEFGMATSRRISGNGGNSKEETCFIDCVAFGRIAEICSRNLSKGNPVFIEGHLRLEQWTDRNGNKRSKHVVVVDNVQILSSVRRAEPMWADEESQSENN